MGFLLSKHHQQEMVIGCKGISKTQSNESWPTFLDTDVPCAGHGQLCIIRGHYLGDQAWLRAGGVLALKLGQDGGASVAGHLAL